MTTIRDAQFDFDADTSTRALEILHRRLETRPEWSGTIGELHIEVEHGTPEAIAGAIYRGIEQSAERNSHG